MKKKIVIIGTTASSVFLFRLSLIELLVKKGFQVTCLAHDFSTEQVKFLNERNVKAINYAISRGGLNPVKDVRDTWALAKLLKKIKPDVVFSYFVKPVIFGTLAAKIAGVPQKVAMLEGLGFAFASQPQRPSLLSLFLKYVQVFLYHISLPFLDCLVFLNPDDCSDLLKNHKIKVKKTIVLGGIGVNLDEYTYYPAGKNKVRFIFVGRLLNEKGIREYISAVKIVKKDHTMVDFFVLGGVDEKNPGGVNLDELEGLIRNGFIEYPGHVENVAEWIKNSSVFVLPSYREGVPRSTQEAMAIGRAVITTDVPGCRETVIDGKNGFLIPPFSPDALAEKMLYFINNPEKINQMGRESRRIAEKKFDVRKVNQRLVKIILGE